MLEGDDNFIAVIETDEIGNRREFSRRILREKVAKKYGLTEKTLRNRIAELRKRGLITKKSEQVPIEKKPLITENDEINLNAIWDIIRNNKKFLIKFSFCTTCLGLAYSLLATIYFASRISLYPAGELIQGGGSLGDFQGLAKSFGLGLDLTSKYIPKFVDLTAVSYTHLTLPTKA